MPYIEVTGLTHEEWGRFWRASLEAIEPGSSKHCLQMGENQHVTVYHHRLGVGIERADWRNILIKYGSGDRTLYEGMMQVPYSETYNPSLYEERLHHIFLAFNGMTPVNADTGLWWTGKSMSVGDTVTFVSVCDPVGWCDECDSDMCWCAEGDVYQCTETGWMLA